MQQDGGDQRQPMLGFLIKSSSRCMQQGGGQQRQTMLGFPIKSSSKCMQQDGREQRQTMFEEVEPPRPLSPFEAGPHSSQPASLDGSVHAPADGDAFPSAAAPMVRWWQGCQQIWQWCGSQPFNPLSWSEALPSSYMQGCTRHTPSLDCSHPLLCLLASSVTPRTWLCYTIISRRPLQQLWLVVYSNALVLSLDVPRFTMGGGALDPSFLVDCDV